MRMCRGSWAHAFSCSHFIIAHRDSRYRYSAVFKHRPFRPIADFYQLAGGVKQGTTPPYPSFGIARALPFQLPYLQLTQRTRQCPPLHPRRSLLSKCILSWQSTVFVNPCLAWSCWGKRTVLPQFWHGHGHCFAPVLALKLWSTLWSCSWGESFRLVLGLASGK